MARKNNVLSKSSTSDTQEDKEEKVDVALRHSLVLGATGFDRLNIFRAYVNSVLKLGGGALLVSPYTDISTFNEIREVCARHGREHDLMLLDLTPLEKSYDFAKVDSGISSYRFNPFMYTSANELTDLIVSLMPDAGAESAMWKGRAIAMMTGVVRALVWLRDNYSIELGPQSLSEYLGLDGVIKLHNDARLPEDITQQIGTYLRSIPGFSFDRLDRLPSTTRDQHGYLEMQFTELLSFLKREIPKSGPPPCYIRFADVINNRRIVVALLPQVEIGSSDESPFGKIVIRSITRHSLKNSLETSKNGGSEPFLCMFDKHYSALGEIEILACYGKRNGIGLVYADDNLSHLKCVNERITESLLANSATKIFLNSDDKTTNRLIPQEELNTLRYDTAFCLRNGAYRLLSLSEDPDVLSSL